MSGSDLQRALANAATALVPGAQRRIPSARGVAVTFDDGPHPVATPRALDALAAAGLRATFFVLADQARAHAAILERCAAEGHEIGLHGCAHESLVWAGARRTRELLERGRRELAERCGRAPSLFRPPYGRWNPARNGLLRALGLRLVLWNRSPADYLPSMDPQRIAAYFRSSLRPGDILLLHDNDATAERIERVIGGLAVALRERQLDALPVLEPARTRTRRG